MGWIFEGSQSIHNLCYSPRKMAALKILSLLYFDATLILLNEKDIDYSQPLLEMARVKVL